MKKTILITGTHLTPALALISRLKTDYQLTYIGPKSTQLHFSNSVINFFHLKAPKLHRHKLSSIILVPAKLTLATIKASQILTTVKPDLVVSFGGFTALPVCLSAKLLRIPIIIHEQTMAVGLANKLTARLATKIAISWPDSQKYFPKSKTVLTGNPVRKDILKVKPNPKSKELKTLYIANGNQGSLVINQTINQILPQLLDNFTIIHQFGLNQPKASWQSQLSLKNALPKSKKNRYTLKKWFNSSAHAANLTKADLILGRSGANIMTELGLLKKPAILIPLPYAQKNEQFLNAKYLEKLGTALVVEQASLKVDKLLKAINQALRTLPRKSSSQFPTQLVAKADLNLLRLVNQVLNDSKKD